MADAVDYLLLDDGYEPLCRQQCFIRNCGLPGFRLGLPTFFTRNKVYLGLRRKVNSILEKLTVFYFFIVLKTYFLVLLAQLINLESFFKSFVGREGDSFSLSIFCALKTILLKQNHVITLIKLEYLTLTDSF